MAKLVWDPEALKTYLEWTDPKKGLPPLRRAQLVERVNALRDWPPEAWYDLRDQRDGTITFRMETDQFLALLGLYEDGVVKITHVELKVKKGVEHGPHIFLSPKKIQRGRIEGHR